MSFAEQLSCHLGGGLLGFFTGGDLFGPDLSSADRAQARGAELGLRISPRLVVADALRVLDQGGLDLTEKGVLFDFVLGVIEEGNSAGVIELKNPLLEHRGKLEYPFSVLSDPRRLCQVAPPSQDLSQLGELMTHAFARVLENPKSAKPAKVRAELFFERVRYWENCGLGIGGGMRCFVDACVASDSFPDGLEGPSPDSRPYNQLMAEGDLQKRGYQPRDYLYERQRTDNLMIWIRKDRPTALELVLNPSQPSGEKRVSQEQVELATEGKTLTFGGKPREIWEFATRCLRDEAKTKKEEVLNRLSLQAARTTVLMLLTGNMVLFPMFENLVSRTRGGEAIVATGAIIASASVFLIGNYYREYKKILGMSDEGVVEYLAQGESISSMVVDSI